MCAVVRWLSFRTSFGLAEETERLAQPTERLGVVLVEPLPVVRKGLSLVIERDPELVVIAEVGTADAAIEFLRACWSAWGSLASTTRSG
jgi:hypothetical protein